jgi:hypothetical protein
LFGAPAWNIMATGIADLYSMIVVALNPYIKTLRG